MTAQWENHRHIQERIIIQGNLILKSPTHLGNGDTDGLLDMPLIRDDLKGQALLTGSSIAGGLRGFLHGHEPKLAHALFGKVSPKQSKESLVIIDDALGGDPIVELRDGVAINPRTRTAHDKQKFDIELLTAGTIFPLQFELIVPPGKEHLVDALAYCLKGLEQGRIYLGKRKRRGFGKCRVVDWKVWRFRLDGTNVDDLIGWLEWDGNSGGKPGTAIDRLLLGKELSLDRPDSFCELTATFSIHTSLLIRSAGSEWFSEGDTKETKLPNSLHLTSIRSNGLQSVVSGTSLAGVLRSRALRIANTLGKDGYAMANDLFGFRPEAGQESQPLTASRIWVDECVIQHPQAYVQNRVKIDRFTGGAYPGALFSEQPVFQAAPHTDDASKETRFEVQLHIDRATDSDVGLILLLLKDLWTGDLPLGGESSVGRGRLEGRHAVLSYQGSTWEFNHAEENQIRISGDGKMDELQKFVVSFSKERLA